MNTETFVRAHAPEDQEALRLMFFAQDLHGLLGRPAAYRPVPWELRDEH